ncbi:MAG: formyl transferase [Actinomycetota bacterium]|nr:formyl transferase [Actinomycetota bacterium]
MSEPLTGPTAQSVTREAPSTHVELRLSRSGLRGWQVELARALSRLRGTSVGATWSGSPLSPPPAPERLLGLERRLHRLPPAGSARADPRQLEGLAVVRPEAGRMIWLDLTGSPDESTRGWSVRFDGSVGEPAAAAALSSGRFPVVEVVDAAGNVITSGRPGSERPGITAAALDDVLAGCVTLVVAAVRGTPLRLPESLVEQTEQGERDGPPPAWRAVRMLARTPAMRAYRAVYRTPHWRVGWRFVDGEGLVDSMRHPASGWNDLPDDGHHFYADPFPLEVDGRTYLFVEDFDHRVGRGVISVVEFDERGPLGTPVCALTHDVHLSYPFVLEDDGERWMIPETSGAGTVELYRATGFPTSWTLDSVLLRDLDASDVTPFRHEGRWWLSATVRAGGSCSDALHLWYADSLRGPWTPHEHNPVVLDISSARPAGRVVQRAGRLFRPAQDGAGGYGSAVTLTEIVHLDPAGYEQRLVARLAAGDGWSGRRLHTLNRAGRLEVIDGSSQSARFPIKRLPGRR